MSVAVYVTSSAVVSVTWNATAPLAVVEVPPAGEITESVPASAVSTTCLPLTVFPLASVRVTTRVSASVPSAGTVVSGQVCAWPPVHDAARRAEVSADTGPGEARSRARASASRFGLPRPTWPKSEAGDICAAVWKVAASADP